jgi:hypothetical protein
LEEKKKSNFLKINEQYGNVVEKKGPLWKTWRRGRNVLENKGT